MVGKERREEDRREGKTRQDEEGQEENDMLLALKLFSLYYDNFSHCPVLILGRTPQDRSALSPNNPFISSVPLQWDDKIIKQFYIRTDKKICYQTLVLILFFGYCLVR